MTRKLGWLLLATALAVPGVAAAQPAAGQTAAPTEEQAQAQRHFQRAKDLYQAGSYRDAIAELESARTLDPKAKELVFNLGIVHEKLAKFDEAIVWFQKYMEMDGVTAAERAKAESIIKRIEGAKREVQASGGTPNPQPNTGPTEGLAGGSDGGAKPEGAAPRGRIDAATIAAASVAVVGLGVGTVFGIRAVALRPGEGAFVTGRDGTYADLTTKTQDAHDSAVVADIGLGVGLIAAGVTALLYFGRSRDAAAPVETPAKDTRDKEARARFRVVPNGGLTPGGAAFGASGTF